MSASSPARASRKCYAGAPLPRYYLKPTGLLKRTTEYHKPLSELFFDSAGLRVLQDRPAADRVTQQGGEGKRGGLERHRTAHAPERPGHVPSTLGDTVEDREAAGGADSRAREASEEAQTLGNRRRASTSTLEQKTGTKTRAIEQKTHGHIAQTHIPRRQQARTPSRYEQCDTNVQTEVVDTSCALKGKGRQEWTRHGTHPQDLQRQLAGRKPISGFV